MSSSSNSSRARVSIPSSVLKTIQNIKEITGNHSEDEIYAMLKECSMDPNETAQKLLFQDTFHEVKRKRDRRKENSIKEAAESKWKTGMQGRGNKGGRGNLTSRHISLDVGGGKNGKENVTNQIVDKSVSLSHVPAVDAKNISSSSSATANGPTGLTSGSNHIAPNANAYARRGIRQLEATADAGSGVQKTPADASKTPRVIVGNRDAHGQRKQNPGNSSTALTSPHSSGVYLSASDPVLVPSQDSRPVGVVGTVRREVGSHRSPIEHVSANSNGIKVTTEISDAGNSNFQIKMPNKFQGPGKNQLQEYPQTASSTYGGSSTSRPSSNYNNRSQAIGPQKVGPSKEWKPKPVNTNPVQGSAFAAATSSDVSTVPVQVNNLLQPPVAVLETKEEVTADLQKKLKETHISNVEHVIIPNHLHVPEAEKLGFCFGSFDTSFSLGTSTYNALENDKSPPISETSECTEEAASEQLPSNQNVSAAAEDTDYSDQPPHPHGQENLSAKIDDSQSSVAESSQPKQEILQAGQQHSVVHTSPNYSFGFMPPMLGSQLASFESSESQPRDVSRLPNFLVQQPIDPTSYYAQFYRSSADSDGRISPFHSAGVSPQYNGNVAVAPPHSSQSSQEGGNTLALSAAAPMPLATQAAGLMQSSIAVPQQPVPVFRQATGMHLPHYPPNYVPYGHYFSPLYVPPTAIHQLLSNGAFSQQPQAGGVYQPAAAARYSLSQYRAGANVGNSAHIGVPGTYAPYGSSPVNYNPNSATSTGNPTSNEDLSASQFHENNVYVSGQQSESSGVWINAANRDMSSLQASSFYNLPQGQVALTPAQPGHGTFTGVYHPAQPMTTQTVHPLMQQSQTMGGPVDMAGPTGSVYQRPQHSQLNWPSSY